MTKRLTGAVVWCLILLAGLWMILAPFALGIQPDDSDWKDETFTDVWTGIGLAVLGLIGVVIFSAALADHLSQRGLIRPRRSVPSPDVTPPTIAADPAPGGTASSELSDLLSPLVTALTQDLQREAAGVSGTNSAGVAAPASNSPGSETTQTSQTEEAQS